MHESQLDPDPQSRTGDRTLRPPAREDASRVLALLDACERADYGTSYAALSDVEWTWSLPRFDLARDARIVTDASGTVVGYVALGSRGDGVTLDGEVQVHPAHRHGELGSQLLSFVERRARELVRGHESGELAIPAASVDAPLGERLERHGFRRGRAFFRMEIELGDEVPPNRMPAGLELRRFRPDVDAARLHEAQQESFARHYRFVAQSLEDWILRRTSIVSYDPTLWFLAWDGEQLAGAMLNYLEPAMAWISELGVRPAWRGRGLGTALLLAGFAEFQARGQRLVALGVDAENADGATRLYERAGMRVTRRTNLHLQRITPDT